MANRGNSNQIIIGAAQLFVADYAIEFDAGLDEYVFNAASPISNPIPSLSPNGDLVADIMEGETNWRNVGYTMNGLELQFQPDFGEVQVDQLLDVAKLYKQGMQVNMVTAFAEATLENLVVAIATSSGNKTGDLALDGEVTLNLSSGDLGEVPVERAILAVGPGSGNPNAVGAEQVERVYVAHRALSIDNVTVSAKRNEPSMYEVSFRLLPASNGSYGKIVDRKKGA